MNHLYLSHLVITFDFDLLSASDHDSDYKATPILILHTVSCLKISSLCGCTLVRCFITLHLQPLITSTAINPINSSHSHKDLGVLISDNLNWNNYMYHDYILKKPYKTPGLLWRIFSNIIASSVTFKQYYP